VKESSNVTNNDGKTPLHFAAESGDGVIARLRLNRWEELINLWKEPIRLLLDGGAKESINATDNDGKTALHLANASLVLTVKPAWSSQSTQGMR
jgi:ankyrin repeat protein